MYCKVRLPCNVSSSLIQFQRRSGRGDNEDQAEKSKQRRHNKQDPSREQQSAPAAAETADTAETAVADTAPRAEPAVADKAAAQVSVPALVVDTGSQQQAEEREEQVLENFWFPLN